MQIANLIRRPATGTSSAKPNRAESNSAEQRDVLLTLAKMLPRLSAAREQAEAALDAIESRVGPRIVPKTPNRAGIVSGPLPGELEAVRSFETRRRHDAAPAKRHVEECRDREAAAHSAREGLALREAMKAAGPVIEARILECTGAVELEQAKVHDAVRTAADLRARRDTLQAKRDGVISRQADIEQVQAQLESAADAGDDAGAEAAAREIARLRREHVETVEPLDLRLHAAEGALERAETQQTRAEERLAEAAKPLREAELDRLKLARDEAAAELRDRDLDLWAAGYSDRSSNEYRIGLTPEVLHHLGGRPQEVSTSFLGSHAANRRLALESLQRDTAQQPTFPNR